MPFQIVRNDITKMKVDAVINTANPRVAYGRGTDQAIYQAAGKEKLLTARQNRDDAGGRSSGYAGRWTILSRIAGKIFLKH